MRYYVRKWTLGFEQAPTYEANGYQHYTIEVSEENRSVLAYLVVKFRWIVMLLPLCWFPLMVLIVRLVDAHVDSISTVFMVITAVVGGLLSIFAFAGIYGVKVLICEAYNCNKIKRVSTNFSKVS